MIEADRNEVEIEPRAKVAEGDLWRNVIAVERDEGVVHDALLRGRVPLCQPAKGYRTNVDALWLSSFARRETPSRRCLDLGAGVGAIGLSLVVTGGARAATLFDVDPSLIALAAQNARAASVDAVVDAMVGDVREPLPIALRNAFDLVVANPPYGVDVAAKKSPHPARARARTGDEGTLLAFARAARGALGAKGRACFVFPAPDVARLFVALRAVGLEPKRMRMVHPLPEAPARVVLVEAKPARPGGLRVEAPLVAMIDKGVWSDEARRIVEGA